MPISIRPVGQSSLGDKTSQTILDLLSFLKLQHAPTDEEAGVLYRMWHDASPGSKVFSPPTGADDRRINALKSKGFITGFGNSLEMTSKGRKLIVEMVTSEPNAFDKKIMPTYSAIQMKKQANRRPRQSLVKRAELKPEMKKWSLPKNDPDDNAEVESFE